MLESVEKKENEELTTDVLLRFSFSFSILIFYLFSLVKSHILPLDIKNAIDKIVRN